ncbi:hypothetical protein V8E55_006282 [Tylopilus felleus]
MHIPVIDIADLSSPDPLLRSALATEIRSACVDVGFFYVKNHGIPDAVIHAATNSAKRFFALQTATKIELDIHRSQNFKGYTALLGENVNINNKGDLHEGFDIGWESIDHDAHPPASGPMSGANVWPENLPAFREDVLAYYHSAVKLGQSLFPIFAVALDLPENFFDDKACFFSRSGVIMRLLHYPPQPASTPEGVEGIGAHTDYECFTILWQDNVPALQVMNTSGEWVDAVPIPGCLVVNLGDQFARWTNDVFKSTLHRAINATGQERYSIPAFFGVDYDVKLEPFPGCVTEDNPAKYEVVTAGEYVKSRLEATYAHSKGD